MPLGGTADGETLVNAKENALARLFEMTLFTLVAAISVAATYRLRLRVGYCRISLVDLRDNSAYLIVGVLPHMVWTFGERDTSPYVSSS
ncbi:hypothetical protein TNCV_571411 [Trichonephila clavipes]|nr:hypothetical protein TNCV_571411 [Trichonephila clavipes]